MARQPVTPWPTTPGSVFFGDAASGATLSRATKDGRIRRLARGLYSADLRADPAELIARNRWKIVAYLVHDAVIADRSAAEGGMPAGGVLTVISNERREDVTLPGLTVAPRPGPGPLDDDGNWPEGLRLTSDARTLVDNLAVSRGRAGRPARTLSRDELEDWVVRTAQRRPDDWLATLRARALELCDELGVTDRREAVADIIGAVAGTREARPGAGRLLAARAAGREYDPDRVARFDELVGYLGALPSDADVPVELPALADEAQTSLPFFEAYFSNFIEGTEFSVEEAEAIVESGEIPDERAEDAHDVLGTFEAVHDAHLRAATPATVEELLELLERRHRLVMGGRPEKRPGQFKERPNQAGSYIFVAPNLIEGTLIEGFYRLADLQPGFARAVFELFLISEVHPYDDGNGRVARAVMCAELTAVDQARLVIPIVFRNEYQTALRNLSREGRCDLYVRTLAYAWRWTAAMPWQDRAAVDGYLVATHALVDSTDAERTGVRLELP
ncbi:MAG: Fic family protein [Actinomycetota bacterium]|nr:Fic family protein [Actinomycetota bacterium]